MYTNDITLPDGWIACSLSKEVVALQRPEPEGGFVTIDFEKRVFAPGYGHPQGYAITSTKTYQGKGWKEAIVKDAIDWLNSLMLSPAGAVENDLKDPS